MKAKRFLSFLNLKRENFDITYEEMKYIKQTNQEVILLDVRSPQEFEEGHINGAINLPLYELCKNAKNKINDTNRIVICYCATGIRSKKAVKILQKCGYKNVYNLKNGIK